MWRVILQTATVWIMTMPSFALVDSLVKEAFQARDRVEEARLCL